MKFVVFAEGYTEKKALPGFLKRWLDPRLSQPVGIKIVRFDGWSDYVRGTPKKANLYLTSYKEITHGAELFGELDPNVAYGKCPCLRIMLDDMITLAEKAGLERVVTV
jgi:hypothetical protein